MSDLEIARDDIALSAIAGGNAPDSDDPTLLLLASFRADLDEAVAEPLRVESTVVPNVVPLASRRKRLSLVGLSAAAGIVVGGLTAGAVAVSDRPGESLYSVHAAFFGERETKTGDVQALLDQASGMLARGDRPAARRLLGQALSLIPTVPDGDQPALRRRHDDLMAFAAEPVRTTPRPSPTATRETPEPRESETDDHSGSNSGSGSSGSGGSTPEPSRSDDNSGSGSSGSGSSGSGSSGSGSSDLKTPDLDDHSGSGGGGSGSGSDD